MQQAERRESTSEKPTYREDRGIIIMSASWKQLFFQILLLLISCRHINTTGQGRSRQLVAKKLNKGWNLKATLREVDFVSTTADIWTANNKSSLETTGPTTTPGVPISSRQTDERSVVFKGESQIERVELLNPVSLTLKCTWAGNQNKLPNITGFWKRDGKEIENSRVTVQLENEQYNLKQVFNINAEEDLGNYSCVFENEAKIDFVLAAPQMGEVRDKPIVSYVGDSVVIKCKLEETKPKPSTWNWYKTNGTDKEQILPSAESHRFEIKNDERHTKLLVHNLTEADSGLYDCGAVYAIGTTMGHVELKVISFHEPLKPFIAIVVEVIVLVAAILLYEKSQSKKNYTAGSETNDQTNTLTQGENTASEGSSSMRQRKV